jgi:glycerol-3-phosphate acyltransferase PlsY
MVARFVLAVIAAYLLGSIPFGLIIGRLRGGVDIRQYGSGKTGATNVMRTVGYKFGYLTLMLDGVKAAIAVLLATLIVDGGSLAIGSVSLDWKAAQVLAGVGAMAGHNWPLFARFRGGRGVAAFFGTLFAIYPPAGLLGVEVLVILALRSRHMSLGSVAGTIAALCLLVPLTVFYGFPLVYLVYCLVVAALIVYQHRDNIRRLRQGVERQLW